MAECIGNGGRNEEPNCRECRQVFFSKHGIDFGLIKIVRLRGWFTFLCNRKVK